MCVVPSPGQLLPAHHQAPALVVAAANTREHLGVRKRQHSEGDMLGEIPSDFSAERALASGVRRSSRIRTASAQCGDSIGGGPYDRCLMVDAPARASTVSGGQAGRPRSSNPMLRAQASASARDSCRRAVARGMMFLHP
jgi:hypothetical protein